MGLLDCSARSQVGTILYRLPTLAAAKGTPTEAGGSTADTEGGLTHKGRGGLPISPKAEQSQIKRYGGRLGHRDGRIEEKSW